MTENWARPSGHSTFYLAVRASMLIGAAALYTLMLVGYAVLTYHFHVAYDYGPAGDYLGPVHGWLTVAALAQLCAVLALRRVASLLAASALAAQAAATLLLYLTC